MGENKYSEKELENFKNGSLIYPAFYTDIDLNVVEVNEIVSTSGMSMNDGVPTVMVILRHRIGESTQRIIYKLDKVSDENYRTNNRNEKRKS